jgi:hypothetical protein
MRALTTVAVVVASLVCACGAGGAARLAYADDPGGGGEWGVFYVCLPSGCGWYLCWPGAPCQRF